MALDKGDITASAGMAKVIYEKLQEVFLPATAASGADITQFQETWQKLAYAIASGVIDHILSNMEIVDIKTKWRNNDTTEIDGTISTDGGHSHTVGGSGTTSIDGGHSHTVKVNGRNNNLVFEQCNNGPNHVQ